MSDGLHLSTEDTEYVDKILTSIKDNLKLSDYEVNLLKSINSELKKPLPTTLAGIETRVNILDMYRVKLLNFIYTVNDKLSTVENNYKKIYDPKFVTLTRAGRPNQQSVDSEIHLDPVMQDSRLLLNNFDSFKGLLFGYLKSMDTIKDTCMQKWRQGGFM